jgi:hypothetical protein
MIFGKRGQRCGSGIWGGVAMKAVDCVQGIARTIAEFFEDQWFDLPRNIRTSGNVSLLRVGIAAEEIHDSELYVPARPAHIRQALRAMPVQDVSDFSYVDLGSGKGRTLFIAAELPFKEIIGVEISRVLHEQACANVRCFRSWTRGCKHITPVYGNAKHFVFPDGKMVLYLFNPFGAATMRCVLSNLDASLTRNPRHVIIILLWPRYGDQVAALQGMHLRRETKEYQIFEAHRPLPRKEDLEAGDPSRMRGVSRISYDHHRKTLRYLTVC